MSDSVVVRDPIALLQDVHGMLTQTYRQTAVSDSVVVLDPIALLQGVDRARGHAPCPVSSEQRDATGFRMLQDVTGCYRRYRRYV